MSDERTQRDAALRETATFLAKIAGQLPAAHILRHPLVAKTAKLPTPAIKRVLSLALMHGVKHRKAVTWWANPVTGKTFCIEVLKVFLEQNFPESGVFVYEPDGSDEDKEEKSPLRSRESRELEFLASLLDELGYDGRMESSIALRRKQVSKALLALALPGRHLFFIIDEVQEMTNERYIALKKSISWLSDDHDVQINFISFGQHELKRKRKAIETAYRSDMLERFLGDLYEFKGMTAPEDLEMPLEACDSGSEYPVGSKKPYTAFLLPKAYSASFRLKPLAPRLWQAFMAASRLRQGESGIAMEYVAEALSELILILAPRDSESLEVTDEDLAKAVAATRWSRRSPVRPDGKSADK